MIATAVALVLIGSTGLTILVGRAIAAGQSQDPQRIEHPDWLADLDLTHDGADRPLLTEAETAHLLSLSDGPSPEFVERTRRVVVAEARRLRVVQS